jgi:DNA recombination protein RmuC
MDILLVVLTAVLTALAVAGVVMSVQRRMAADARVQAEADRALTLEQVRASVGDRLSDRLESDSRAMDLRQDSIHQQVDGMNRELAQLRNLVGTLQREKAERDTEILARLDETVRTTSGLAESTRDLRDALASPKARGQWGERMAEDVLQAAGLREGFSYRKQTATSAGTIPDFTFLLPRGLHLHMDVKFPVDNYVKFLAADTDAERTALRQTFLRDVRQRMKELRTREYADPAQTVGYLLMFIPNEAVYAFIHEHDQDLLGDALGQRIVPCSPSTLFAVLAVVRQAVDNFAIERTSEEILTCLAGFNGEWGKFTEKLDNLGARLETARKAYDELNGPRRRQLERKLDRIDELREDRGIAEPAVDLTEAEVTPLRLEAG